MQIEFWQLISAMAGLIVAFLTFAFGAGRLLLSQMDRRLTERFNGQEESRTIAQKHWDEKFSNIINQNRRDAEDLQRIEREFLALRAELPLNYVRREDYIRGQSVLEAKMDALYNRLEYLWMKGKQSD